MNTSTPMRPLVALLTDFGDRDGYAGTMRGVILSHCPDARVVDLANHVPSQCVDSAAFVLHNSIMWFPPRTVFLCVVDPGVGTERRILAARFPCGRQAVAPDNGLLRYVLEAAPGTEVVALAPGDNASTTFHGRDVMAPAAARLASGEALTALGPEVDAARLAEPLVPQRGELTGPCDARVVYVDCFGTLVLDLPHCIPLARASSGSFPVIVPARTYADAPASTPVLVRGSSGLWEIALRNGSAADLLTLGINATVCVEPGHD